MHYFEETVVEEEELQGETFEAPAAEEPPFVVAAISFGPMAVEYTSTDYALPGRTGRVRVEAEMIVDGLMPSWVGLGAWLQEHFDIPDLELATFAVDIAAALRDTLQPLAVEVTVTHFIHSLDRPKVKYTAAFACQDYYDELQKSKD